MLGEDAQVGAQVVCDLGWHETHRNHEDVLLGVLDVHFSNENLCDWRLVGRIYSGRLEGAGQLSIYD